MVQASRPDWAKRILKLLAQAKAKDAELERFGADSHQYKLSAPAKEQAIHAFEEQQGIRLPEEYREFLLQVGNGGAGPFYGLYGLKQIKQQIEDSDCYQVQAASVIYPKMSQEDWDKVVALEEGEETPVYAGVLPIGDQGCTLMTGLMMNGPYRGQVVYYDEDYCGQPFFMREKGFLQWYERWLREVIAGYDDETVEFGLNVDGNPDQLMELYEQTKDLEEKIDIIDSYYKFQSLPEKQKTYFKQVCTQESNIKVRMKLIKMLAYFHVPGMSKEIETLWEQGAYGEAVSIISEAGGWKMKEAWYERIFEVLPKLRGDSFQEACYIFKGMEDYPGVHAGRFREILMREDLDRNDYGVLFYCIQYLNGKEEVLDYFLDYLPKEEDSHMLIGAIQAMTGVKDRRLQEIYVKLLDKYKTHENAKFDYEGSQMVLKNGCCLGASRPEGMIVSNLIHQFDLFGLDYRGAWKLLMNAERWAEWKQQNGF